MPYVNLEGHEILPRTAPHELPRPEENEEFSLVLSTYEEIPCQAWLMLVIGDLKELDTLCISDFFCLHAVLFVTD